MTPIADRILLIGIAGAALGFVLAFIVSPLVEKDDPDGIIGWLGARVIAVSFCVAIFSTCGVIK